MRGLHPDAQRFEARTYMVILPMNLSNATASQIAIPPQTNQRGNGFFCIAMIKSNEFDTVFRHGEVGHHL